MKKIDLPLFFDALFAAACAWLFSVGVLRYLRAPMWVSLLSASLLALAAGLAGFALLYAARARRALSRSERERKDKLMLHLALQETEAALSDLEAAFAADGRSPLRGEGTLSVDGETLVPLFTVQPVSADEIARLFRIFGREPFTPLLNDLTPEAEKLLSSFGRRAVRGEEIYALFARTKTFPDPLFFGNVPRPKLREKLRRAFSKKNARPFFVSGALLLVMSLFVLFPLSYLVSGSVLIFLSLCIRLLGAA